MVAGSITKEVAVAVSAEQLWKAAFAKSDESTLCKALAGMIDAVKVDGDGGPGSRLSLKFNPAVSPATVLKGRLAARDNTARVISWDEVAVEGGQIAPAQFKKQVVQMKVEPASAGRCVTKVAVDYERLDGAPLSPADQAKLINGYIGLVKKAEENIIARPGVFA
ncbi:hypothetical protein HU200_008305 [Digitaria exilis]|uniref:Bet v I/Major latex protein domain-containing protein n=1 Tax=Digitaria exilis TaxID=1010633 RepID=A0A835KP57_9POAL|nr:hypothetical protein HU200_008305 [Digitaria exilis]CAB3465409.1 unnamed protein product [Digitaria exilis]